jgi:plasmid maintenance system antidote protein VapI
MEQAGYTQADLAALLGSRSRASEILQRRRALTMGMAAKLSREWRIPAESLIAPMKRAAAARASGRGAATREGRSAKESEGAVAGVAARHRIPLLA